MSFFSRNTWFPRRSLWYGTFLGRLLSLALSSAASGFFIGALVGLDNWLSLGSAHPWWYWVGFTSMANTIWMLAFGLLVGVPLFGGLAAFEMRWSKQRHARFSLGVGQFLCRPLFMVLCLMTIPVLLFCFIRSRGPSPISGSSDALVAMEIVVLPIASLILTIILAYKTKRGPKSLRRKRLILTERLLPID